MRNANNIAVGGLNMAGAAAGFDINSAYFATIAEHLERYCSAFRPRSGGIQQKTYKELVSIGHSVIHPKEYTLFADFQYRLPRFPFVKFEEDTRLDWVFGFDPIAKQNVLVPECASVTKPSAGVSVCRATTNGFGAGSTVQMAMLSAIQELIERDAVCFSWWTKTSSRVLEVSSTKNRRLQTVLQTFPDIQNYTLLYCRLDHSIPTIMAVYKNSSDNFSPAFTLTATCKLNPHYAVEKALLECAQSLSYRRVHSKHWRERYSHNFDDTILDFKDGMNFFSNPVYASIPNLLINTDDKVFVDDLENLDRGSHSANLDFVCKELVEASHNPLFVDHTTEDVRRCGLHVYKAIVPSFIEINATHQIRRWGGERILDLKRKLNLSAHRLRIQDLNHLPHPFP